MRATRIPPLTRFEREAAIKVLPESLISDRDRFCRFEQEAHVAAEDLRYDDDTVAYCFWHELVSMSVRFVAKFGDPGTKNTWRFR